MIPRQESAAQREYVRKLAEIGDYESISTFFSKYGNIRTRHAYAVYLAKYFKWLKGSGVMLNPDDLVKDNLACIFKSDPTDVQTKKRHTKYLDQFVNDYLIKQGMCESTRAGIAATIREFYRRNDSPLWGDFEASKSSALSALKSEGSLAPMILQYGAYRI